MAESSSINLTPLSADACPLLAKFGSGDAERLVTRFNQAISQVQELESDRLIGPRLATEKFSKSLAKFDSIRDLMTRRKYIVGFIGITQAGKSTTVNNVLGEEVCKVGAMDATSSQPCRIVKSSRRSLDVEFLTAQVADTRRQKLCQAIGMATPGENRDLLSLLSQPERFRLTDGQEPPRLKDDLKFLKDFIQALESRKDLLTTKSQVRANLSYDQRYEYTTHSKGSSSPEVLLLREARFHIDNPALPDDLELCDLPGLDSKRTIDDLVTWEYLPSLHGTFLFVNAGSNLMTEGMLKILTKINEEFDGKVGGRAWVIFNKMDSLTGDSFRTGGQDNIFTTIARFLERTGIPESQVCFGSKKIWDAAHSTPTAIADAAFAAQTMSQSTEKPVPDTCPPGLRTAWLELLKDGGVSLIRRLMFHEVAVTLAGEIRSEVDRSLEAFSSEFTALVNAERKRAKLDQSDLQSAMTCYHAVLNTRVGLVIRMAEYPVLLQEIERLRQSLGQLFDMGAQPEALAHLSQDQLAHQFRAHAKVLDQAIQGQLAGDILDKVYEEIGTKLNGLPAVPVGPNQQGCQDAWRVIALQDRADESWVSACPRFSNPEMNDWLAQPSAEGLAGEIYVDLMHGKIDAVVRQTAQMLRSRLRYRLGQLFVELAQLTGERDVEAV